jgi:hypothetical protein
MKSVPFPFPFLALLLVTPLHGQTNQFTQLIPAGSLIECTMSDPTFSSKTAAVGDPVLCGVRYSGYGLEQSGTGRLPYDSYLVGHFEDYKDPGHLVGKGWMELTFERIVIEPDKVIPLHARVVGVSGYKVDREGHILGKGHAGRDIFEWTIPILWPIDMINLPRRGPRPTLKAETRLTLKVMDDIGAPGTREPQETSPGLYRRPSSYTVPPPAVNPAPPPPSPAYVQRVMPPPLWYRMPPSPWYRYVPPPQFAAPSGAPIAEVQNRRSPYSGPGSQEIVTLVFDDGRPPEQIQNYMLTSTAIYVPDGYRHYQVYPLDPCPESRSAAAEDQPSPGPVARVRVGSPGCLEGMTSAKLRSAD